MRPTLPRVLAWLILTSIGSSSAVPAGAAASEPATQPSTAPSTAPSTRPATQPAGEYIEYRALPALSRISISDCAVRGAKAVGHLTDAAAELAKDGVFVCTDDKQRHVYRRTERMGGRKVDTLIAIEPPPAGAAADDEEAVGTQRLIVRVDGRRKVDCTIGTSADGELWVSQVVIHPEDATLEVHAVTADGAELTLPDEWMSLDDPTVITNDSFFEDDPPEGGKRPEKA